MTTPPDWIMAAAAEIRRMTAPDHGALDGLGLDTEGDIRAVIAKHCPMEPDVAYMQVPRCETCRHWRQVATVEGYCMLPEAGLRLSSEDDRAMVVTSANFGCVGWMADQDDEDDDALEPAL